MHYKSGHPYPHGTLSTAVNIWKQYTYELNGQGTFPTQRRNDYTAGLVIESADRYHFPGDHSSYNGHAILTPAYYYTASSGLEDPDFRFFITSKECMAISVPDISAFTRIRSWPNPAGNFLNLTVRMNMPGRLEVTLTNVMGQVVRSVPLERVNAGNDCTITIPTGDLPAGVYHYAVSTEGQRMTRRVAIVH
jgi:hypothetical protein